MRHLDGGGLRDVGTSVRKRGEESFEGRVNLGMWSGPRISVGFYQTEEMALSVLRAIRAGVERMPQPWTPLTVWRVAVTGLGFSGQAEEELKKLLPLWVERSGSGYTHRLVKKGGSVVWWYKAELAYRSACVEWWKKYRRQVIKRAKRLIRTPSLEAVAMALNSRNLLAKDGEPWTKAKLKELLKTDEKLRRRRKRKRGGG